MSVFVSIFNDLKNNPEPTKLRVVPGVVRGDHFHTFLLFPLDDTVHGNRLAPNLENKRGNNCLDKS